MTHRPFLYVIGWTELNAWYLGCRYGRKCQPIDLWTTYFTSSKQVALLREQFGEPDYFEVLAEGDGAAILELENLLLSELCLQDDPRWLNRSAGWGKKAKICTSPQSARLIGEANKGKKPWNKGVTHSPATRRKLSEKLSGMKRSPEVRAHISSVASGERNPMFGRQHSEESRRLMSEKRRASVERKRAAKEEECPI